MRVFHKFVLTVALVAAGVASLVVPAMAQSRAPSMAERYGEEPREKACTQQCAAFGKQVGDSCMSRGDYFFDCVANRTTAEMGCVFSKCPVVNVRPRGRAP